MRIVVQKVKKAEVVIDEKTYSSIGHGIAAFVGISRTDTITDIKYSLEKLINLRIFEDTEGKLVRIRHRYRQHRHDGHRRPSR